MTATVRSPLAELLAGLPVDVETDPANGAEAAFSPDRRYRYALTRTWDPGATALTWVMLNPSTADAFRLDPTVTRCVDFSHRWGFGGLLVLNAYALRSTNPRLLRGNVEPIGPRTDVVMRRLLTRRPRMMGDGPPVVCAWGANVQPGRAAYLLDLIRETGNVPHCLGLTRGGHPRHPLRIAGRTPLEEAP